MRCRMSAWTWPGACSRRWRGRPGASRAMARGPSAARRAGSDTAGRGVGELVGGQAEGSAAARSADGTKDTKGPKDTQGARGRGQGANALTIVPATKKVGAPGCALDVPLTHINASYVRSHFDTIELRVPGAPAADELIVILAMSTGPRIHARVGGLAAADISQWNGLR